ncbi:MAG TPA: CHRD domain-containing protein [Usitatibacter sp.]|nr:CHRD domain-containing protein [Usitatibacter sp.]
MRAIFWQAGLRFLAASGAALGLCACGGGTGSSNFVTKSIALNGAQENPAVTTAATGSGTITVNLDSGAVSGSFTTFGINGLFAHIHEGAVGVNGPILVEFVQGPAGTWTLPSDARLVLSSQVESFKAGNLYVNVHSAVFPGGETRAQIGRQVFFATLTGAQETPPVVSSAAGVGRFVFDPETRSLSGTVTTSGITGVAAHLHIGAIGVGGPVSVPMTGGPATWAITPGTILTDLQAAALTGGTLYANVHSSANPGGEIRGQVYLPAKSAALTGAQETPPNASMATGTGWLVVNPFTHGVAGRIETQNINAVAAHVHRGAAAVGGPVVIPMTSPTPGVWMTAPSAVVSEDLLASFMKGELYLNVHSSAFPGGEIRGQLTNGQ